MLQQNPYRSLNDTSYRAGQPCEFGMACGQDLSGDGRVGEGRRRRALRGALAVIALALTACAAPLPPAADPDEAALLADFRRVAYGSEGPVLGNDGSERLRGDHLAKWDGPIRFALVDVQDAAQRAAARAHFADLAALTGLAIAETSPAEANFLVFYADDPFEAARRHRALYAGRLANPRSFDALLARMQPRATCFGFLWGGWPSGQGIDFAVTFLRTDRGARTVQGCLVQETTQALGLINDLDLDAPSAFTDSGEHVELTGLDRLMVRLLYDEHLRPGMSWAEAEPLARAALRNLGGTAKP
jgi:hypothetical protein